MSGRILSFVGGLLLTMVAGIVLLALIIVLIGGLAGHPDVDLWTPSGSSVDPLNLFSVLFIVGVLAAVALRGGVTLMQRGTLGARPGQRRGQGRTVLGWADRLGRLITPEAYERTAYRVTAAGLELRTLILLRDAAVTILADGHPDGSRRTVIATDSGIRRELIRDRHGVWRIDGVVDDALAGAAGVDFALTPVLRAVTLAGLDLRVGDSEAWGIVAVTWPDLAVAREVQRWERLGARRYGQVVGGEESPRVMRLALDGTVEAAQIPSRWARLSRARSAAGR